MKHKSNPAIAEKKNKSLNKGNSNVYWMYLLSLTSYQNLLSKSDILHIHKLKGQVNGFNRGILKSQQWSISNFTKNNKITGIFVFKFIRWNHRILIFNPNDFLLLSKRYMFSRQLSIFHYFTYFAIDDSTANYISIASYLE